MVSLTKLKLVPAATVREACVAKLCPPRPAPLAARRVGEVGGWHTFRDEAVAWAGLGSASPVGRRGWGESKWAYLRPNPA